MPLDPRDIAAVGTDLKRLADLLRDCQMRLPGRSAMQFTAERDEILLAFDGYLEPRIGAPDAPIVASIVGPGGAGKSTLLNSIAQQTIAATGVIRPTTRFPLVWADVSHPADYWGEFSARISRHLGERVDSVLGESPLTEHLTVIDTPPLDQLGSADIADQAVALSDLCIFVTTPTRYADGRAWDFLRRNRRRGIPILFVLNRLPADVAEQEAILGDFAARLHQRELLAAPDASLLFGLAEGDIGSSLENVEVESVSGIRKELTEVADPVYRQGLVDETLYATARMVAERARALTRPMAAEQPVVEILVHAVATAYEAEALTLDEQLELGELSSTSRQDEWAAAASDVAGVVTRRAGAAASRAATAWSRQEETAELVELENPELWRHGRTTSNATILALESWKSGLAALAATHARAGRLRWRSGPRAVDALWRTTLSGGGDLPRRTSRKFADGGRGIVATARAELSEALREGLAHDAARFTRFLGSDGGEDLYAAIVDQADLLDARLDGLASQIPSSWSEPVENVEVVAPDSDEVVSIQVEEGSVIVELGGQELYRRIEAVGAQRFEGVDTGGQERSQ